MLKDTFDKVQQDGMEREDIKYPSDEEMMQAFKEYDLNNNGRVEKNEMQQYIRKQLGCPLEEAEDEQPNEPQ